MKTRGSSFSPHSVSPCCLSAARVSPGRDSVRGGGTFEDASVTHWSSQIGQRRAKRGQRHFSDQAYQGGQVYQGGQYYLFANVLCLGVCPPSAPNQAVVVAQVTRSST